MKILPGSLRKKPAFENLLKIKIGSFGNIGEASQGMGLALLDLLARKLGQKLDIEGLK